MFEMYTPMCSNRVTTSCSIYLWSVQLATGNLPWAAVCETGTFFAGGIADGRQIAAALLLGAEAAVLGTSFAASKESIYPAYKKAAMRAASSQSSAAGISGQEQKSSSLFW